MTLRELVVAVLLIIFSWKDFGHLGGLYLAAFCVVVVLLLIPMQIVIFSKG